MCMGSSSRHKWRIRKQGCPNSHRLNYTDKALVPRTCPRRNTRQVKWRPNRDKHTISITTTTTSNILHSLRRPSRRTPNRVSQRSLHNVNLLRRSPTPRSKSPNRSIDKTTRSHRRKWFTTTQQSILHHHHHRCLRPSRPSIKCKGSIALRYRTRRSYQNCGLFVFGGVLVGLFVLLDSSGFSLCFPLLSDSLYYWRIKYSGV